MLRLVVLVPTPIAGKERNQGTRADIGLGTNSRYWPLPLANNKRTVIAINWLITSYCSQLIILN